MNMLGGDKSLSVSDDSDNVNSDFGACEHARLLEVKRGSIYVDKKGDNGRY